MARAAVPPERLVGHFRNVRAAHHHRHARGAHRVGHAIGLCDHSGHRADAHQPDVLFTHESRDAFFIHRLRVAVDQHHFMARRRQRLQQKHPKMRHEIACDPVIGVVQQNSHQFRLHFASSLPVLDDAEIARPLDDPAWQGWNRAGQECRSYAVSKYWSLLTTRKNLVLKYYSKRSQPSREYGRYGECSWPRTKSGRKPSFDVEKYLNTSGIARKIVNYREGRDYFFAGRLESVRSVSPARAE